MISVPSDERVGPQRRKRQMAAREERPQEGKPGPRKRVPQDIWFWWLVIGALVIWNVLSLWPRSSPEVAIPYSTFLEQIRADNVSKVHIVGDRITGAFVKPLLWPKPEPTDESKPVPQASASGLRTKTFRRDGCATASCV
jgi:hypothetical protein